MTCTKPHVKQLPILHPEDPVRILKPHSHKWEPGTVKSHTDTPRSYVVIMADGSTCRCNHSHNRPTGENITLHDGSDMETVEPKSNVQEDSVPTSLATCPKLRQDLWTGSLGCADPPG